MVVVVELWKARPSWFERSLAERTAYLESVSPAIRELLANGTELVALEAAEDGNSPESDHEYDYWAIWRFPDEHYQDDFTHVIESVGWHKHFERVEIDLEARSLEEILPKHADLP